MSMTGVVAQREDGLGRCMAAGVTGNECVCIFDEGWRFG